MNEKQKFRQRKEFADLLIRAIRSGISGMQILTREEERCTDSFELAAKETGMPLFFWKMGMGLREKGKSPVEGTIELSGALAYVQRNETQAIFVFFDLEQFSKSFSNTPIALVIRMLKEMIFTFPKTKASLFMVSSTPELPAELAGLIRTIDFPLPDLAELMDLLEEVRNHGYVNFSHEEAEQVAVSLKGLSYREADDLLAETVIMKGEITISDIPFLLMEKSRLVSRVRGLEFMEVDIDVSQVGGMDLFIKWVRELKNAYTKKGKDFGLIPCRGVLLLGPPGTGKSMAAKVVASILELPLIRINIGALFDKYVGGTEEIFRTVQRRIEACSPAVILIDEIEKGLGGANGKELDGGTSSRLYGELLTWGQERKGDIFFVATANEISSLPPASIRSDRFNDDIFFVDLPSKRERNEIFSIYIRAVKRDPNNFNLNFLAKNSEGFSGSEIKSIVRKALYSAFVEGVDLKTKHILEQLKKTYPLSKTMAEEIGRMRKWAKDRTRPVSSDASNDDEGQDHKDDDSKEDDNGAGQRAGKKR